MTAAPSRISHRHQPHRLPHVRFGATVLRVVIAVLLALALLLLLDGATGESGAVGAVAAVSAAGWAVARRRRR